MTTCPHHGCYIPMPHSHATVTMRPEPDPFAAAREAGWQSKETRLAVEEAMKRSHHAEAAALRSRLAEVEGEAAQLRDDKDVTKHRCRIADMGVGHARLKREAAIARDEAAAAKAALARAVEEREAAKDYACLVENGAAMHQASLSQALARVKALRWALGRFLRCGGCQGFDGVEHTCDVEGARALLSPTPATEPTCSTLSTPSSESALPSEPSPRSDSSSCWSSSLVARPSETSAADPEPPCPAPTQHRSASGDDRADSRSASSASPSGIPSGSPRGANGSATSPPFGASSRGTSTESRPPDPTTTQEGATVYGVVRGFINKLSDEFFRGGAADLGPLISPMHLRAQAIVDDIDKAQAHDRTVHRNAVLEVAVQAARAVLFAAGHEALCDGVSDGIRALKVPA